MGPLTFILVAVVVLIAGVFVAARELDLRDDRRERDARRRLERVERDRRELADLNDDSWAQWLVDTYDADKVSWEIDRYVGRAS